MTGDVDLATAAALLHRSTSWLGRHWRTLKHPDSGAAFPQPFVGAEPRGRPWWRRAAIEAWKDGQASELARDTAGYSAQRDDVADAWAALPQEFKRPLPEQIVIANDAERRRLTDRAARLRAAAGG